TKEHGPHLLLKNDYVMAEYLLDRVMEQLSVAVLPTLQYGYYPAFLDYPGSVCLKADTFRDVIIDICESMSGYGIKKFYILNTGVSTLVPLKNAASILNKKRLILHYFNILKIDERLPEGILTQEGGTHADEGETSFMLYAAPETVNMEKAVKDYDPRPNLRGLSREYNEINHYSPTGIWGDPTLATREKGQLIEAEMIKSIVNEVKKLIDLEEE
ncbi:MAG: creatininase family protein, partial [Candidatus Heimdallarchaeota archaeon]|nr:creatininase family protein [Candidatus Heimdallarchaeota archaeon]